MPYVPVAETVGNAVPTMKNVPYAGESRSETGIFCIAINAITNGFRRRIIPRNVRPAVPISGIFPNSMNSGVRHADTSGETARTSPANVQNVSRKCGTIPEYVCGASDADTDGARGTVGIRRISEFAPPANQPAGTGFPKPKCASYAGGCSSRAGEADVRTVPVRVRANPIAADSAEPRG